MTAIFAGQHPCFRFIGRTSLFEIKVNFSAVTLWTHVRFCGKNTSALVWILDDFILTLLCLRCRLGFWKIDFFSIHLHFHVCRACIATFVVRTRDVSGRTREGQRPTFRAKHGQAIDLIHLIMVVMLSLTFYLLRLIINSSNELWQHSIPSVIWVVHVAVVLVAISGCCEWTWRCSWCRIQ